MKNTNKNRFFKGLSKNVIFLGIVSLLNDASTELVYPLLPIFLSSSLGASNLFIGLIEGIAETVASLFKLISGYLSDRLGMRKGLALFGYTVSSLTRPIIAMALLPWHILAARAVDRVGKGIRTSPRDALLAASSDEQSRGKAFGLHRSFDHMGAVIGPLLASLILFYRPGDYRFVFWVAIIPAFLSIFVLAFFVKEKAPAVSPLSKKITLFKAKAVPKNLKLFLIAVLLFTLGNSSDAFLLLRAKNLGIPVAMIPILWVYFHVVKMLSSTPSGMVSDNIGRKRTILIGWIIYALVYLGFGLSSSAVHVWVLFGIYGLYYGLTEGVEKAFVADLIEENLRGTAYGLYNVAIGIMSLPASLIMGLIWDRYGIFKAFAFGSLFAFIASLVLIFFVSEGRKIKAVG